jgi:hypothetical protein
VASKIVTATYADVVYVARRMRPKDAEEIFPLIWNPTPENLALYTIAAGGIGHVALWHGEPSAAFGAVELRPTQWTVWMFATWQWPNVASAATKFIRREIGPELQERGDTRADCWSMETHDSAHRWLEMLGATREASLKDYGPSRKTFHCYSWTRSQLENGELNVFLRK